MTNIATQLCRSPSSLIYAKPIAQGLTSIYPDFVLGDMFTKHGIQLVHLSDQLQACNSVDFQLLANPEERLRPDSLQDWYIPAFVNRTAVGGHPISSPMLVLQGTTDSAVNYIIPAAALVTTLSLHPKSQIE